MSTIFFLFTGQVRKVVFKTKQCTCVHFSGYEKHEKMRKKN